MSTHTMFDDANVNNFPTGAYAYAGYIDGYVTFPWLEQHAPHSNLLSITVRNNNAARCIDVEPGASSQSAIPGFLNAHKGDKRKPVLYLMAGQAGSICSWLGNLGHHRSDYVLWTAHVGQGEHFCGPRTCGLGPGSNGTQWTWTAMGRALDQSIIDESFFGSDAPAPKPVDPNAVEVKAGFFRQVAGETTPVESLFAWAHARKQTTEAIFEHSFAKDSPLNAKNRAELSAYRNKDGEHKGAGLTMPHGLVFYSFHK